MYVVAQPVNPEVSLLNYVIALLIDEVGLSITTRMNVTSEGEKLLSATAKAKAVSEQPKT